MKTEKVKKEVNYRIFLVIAAAIWIACSFIPDYTLLFNL